MSDEKKFDFEAAEQLPQVIRFGTSSWTYPGWRGTVYKKNYPNEKDLKAKCLEEYGHFPWFRTLGIDSFFYSPPRAETLQRYASQLPQSFPWVSKVWEEITIPEYAKHPRYGTKAGRKNPDFLNVDKFVDKVLTPYDDSETTEHTGPFVFQFQMLGTKLIKEPSLFLEQLDSFLGALPARYQYSIEVRDSALLVPEYFALINKHNVSHCFNHWSYMPSLKIQMEKAADAGGISAPFFVARILTPLGFSYNKAVEQFRPYDLLKVPIPKMRADVVRLVKRALKRNVTAYILVNNRAEGNAPQTIDAIGRMIIESISQPN